MNDDEPEPGQGSEYHPESISWFLIAALVLTALAPMTWLVVAAVGCLALTFLFALFENSLEHHSHARLMVEAKRRDNKERLEALLEHDDELLFVSKVGRGLSQMAATALVVVALVAARATVWQVVGWTAALALAYLVTHVVAPFLLGRRVGHRVLVGGLGAYSVAITPLKPLSGLLLRLAGRITGSREEPDPSEEIADELHSVLEEGAREGTLQVSEKEMIEGVMDLREVTAEHVMTPRTELVCVTADAAIREAIEKSQEGGLSRLPVYRGTPDEIVGVLYMKDLLPHWGSSSPPAIATLVRRPFFVPASKNVGDLLAEMKASQIHLAIVVDEYGGTAGVVSIEDILEEIVGEIADEHEVAAKSDVVRINENAATVEGRAHIDDLNEALDIEVPESEEYDTVGGMLFSSLGRVPAAGESYEHKGVRFTVLEADERRIHRVKVTVQRGAKSSA
ncbi:MAG: hemolysin family protein [Planctomycetota bacterium]|nr:hemolysin family protein [Planctomycetota bacterium]